MLYLALLASGYLSYSQIHRHKKRRNLQKRLTATADISLATQQNIKQKCRAEKILLEKRQIDKDFGLSSLALTVSSAGVFLYPPLLVPAFGIYAYLSRPILEKAYHSLKNSQADIHVVYGIALPGILLSGYYLTGALNYWLYAFSQKVLLNAKANKRERLPIEFVHLPKQVWLIKDGIEINTVINDINSGDQLFLRAGDMLATDGIITQVIGNILITDYQLSGNHSAKTLYKGDRLLAGQYLLQGDLYMQVKKAPKDSRLMRLNQSLQQSNTQDLDRPLKGEQLANDIVIPTLAVSALALPIAGTVGMLAILESCVGEAMRITIPMNTLNFLKKAFEQGFLIKDGRILEDLPDINYLLIDFTDLNPEQYQSLIDQLKPLSAEGLNIQGFFDTDPLIDDADIVVYICQQASDKYQYLSQLQQKHKKILYIGTDLDCSRHAHIALCLQTQAIIACHAANIIILKDNFNDLPHLFKLSKELKYNLEVSTVLSIIPGASIISGVFFAHLGIASSFMVYYGGLLVSIGHANRPLKLTKKEDSIVVIDKLT